ncbi:TetR/AcrR family transcriptional regulator [Pseudothauera nasutitermitis]|uniref:TetR/AcrR family transcriptional regulator n=1 Tax=Pseudothauera nasutitermitis TaxID=2565930 RepID=A0A4S4B2X5_9RHOO|nr:TetR/AcrR family transcriptional regulator [Pseudothauera nasutitermitis]THF66535.1 TetR/AcrR family transcriptional regulator [Pseudothauera nasutitermitis]
MPDAPKKSTRRKLPESVRREAILKAAQLCFARRGYTETSVSDIADAAQLTKGGVYFHFASKEEIRLALIREFTSQTLSAIDNIVDGDAGATQNLRKTLALLLERMSREDGLLLSVIEAVARHHSGIDEIRAYYQALSTKIIHLILDGRASGEFHGEIDAEMVAEALLSMLSGLALHHELDRAGVHLCKQQDQMIDYMIGIARGAANG